MPCSKTLAVIGVTMTRMLSRSRRTETLYQSSHAGIGATDFLSVAAPDIIEQSSRHVPVVPIGG